MGDVINLQDRRARRGQPVAEMPSYVAEADTTVPAGLRSVAHGGHGPAPRRPMTFFFDPVAPESYLAAERVDRVGSDVTWVPVRALPVPGRADEDARRRTVAARAAALRLPLVWPEPAPGSVRAVRVATLAAERGSLPAFALAAGRLVYCGGYDLDDPEILAEAAAAAGLGMDACLRAAADASRDLAPQRAAGALADRGADRLPCFEVGATLFPGEQRLPEALAAMRAPVRAPRPYRAV